MKKVSKANIVGSPNNKKGNEHDDELCSYSARKSLTGKYFEIVIRAVSI